LSELLKRRLALLANAPHRAHLSQGLRGIEREALRVDAAGLMALTPHPPKLGSALTNAEITTDYSESLLEFITPAEHDAATVLDKLDAIHRFAYTVMGDELISSQSMPTHLPAEDLIPIAWYGTSHIGMLKHVYRRGLALRYGKSMQCISGIHYNFSLPPAFWNVLREAENAPDSAMDFQSEAYVSLIRNFHRYSWLLMYLFGASPTLATEFLQGRPHKLDTLSADTLYLPFATSLRMSDLGYQNNAQAGLVPPYNSLCDYMRSLSRAVRLPYPAYEALGTKRDGEWVQINSNILQIENEFYATIRPKRVIRTGERPLEALSARGVEYVEVRCMDVDPFEPVGINLQTTRFLDAFLLFCALSESPPTNDAEGVENTGNFARTVKEGRRPGLQLQRGGQAIGLQEWGVDLLDKIATAAALLDRECGDGAHVAALEAQRSKLADPDCTPSARVLREVQANGGSLAAFALAQSRAHAAQFRARGTSETEQRYFTDLADASLAEQARMEREQSGDFDTFITDYRSRTPQALCE
jgi:glutamate--cysteine ligase